MSTEKDIIHELLLYELARVDTSTAARNIKCAKGKGTVGKLRYENGHLNDHGKVVEMLWLKKLNLLVNTLIDAFDYF